MDLCTPPCQRLRMSPNIAYATTMVLAGIGIPILAALNSVLGQRLGSPAAAALCLFTVAFAATAIVALLTGPSALKSIGATAPFVSGGALCGILCAVDHL
jgi:uncharacterized membrane protein YdcZ (DUF606 family)